MTIDKKYEHYLRRLDAALVAYMNGDHLPFERLAKAYAIELPSHPVAYECAVMKLVCSRQLPQEMKDRAAHWLAIRGFSTEI